jgi:phospholipid/cholesterol/gamma-HCH transport system permease protein
MRKNIGKIRLFGFHLQRLKIMNIAVSTNEDIVKIDFSGDFIRFSDDTELKSLYSLLAKQKYSKIIAADSGVGKWDSSLLVILFDLGKYAQANNLIFDYSYMNKGVKGLTDLAFSVDRKPTPANSVKLPFLAAVGDWGLNVIGSTKRGFGFLKDVCASVFRFFRFKAVMRGVDFLFALEDCGYKAVSIVSLISFMVGLILAFVGAVQLQMFGAEVYVAALVAIGMTRIMGAVMAGIIMAGRTGASYAATIGTMQVNEEVDALKTFGIPIMDFLVLPRILALTVTMPLLTILADFMGMVGGVFVSVVLLGVSYEEYWNMSLAALKLNNFLVGVFHGWIFGIIIALCGCYFGIKSGKNADSVGKATTSAVVYSIVWIVVATGVITVICNRIGV